MAVADTYTCDPTGKLNSSTGTVTNPWPFASGYTVASFDQWTSLEKFGQRYLLTGIGRWTQQDAIPNAFDTNGDNRYVYAGADPVNFSDPSGQLSCGWCGRAAGTLAGLVFLSAGAWAIRTGLIELAAAPEEGPLGFLAVPAALGTIGYGTIAASIGADLIQNAWT